MKTMTCKQLGGACDVEFCAETFEQMAELSKRHGMAMFQVGVKAHLKAMQDMKELMENPLALKEWFDGKQREFDSLPDENL
jgi:hypothetical protein